MSASPQSADERALAELFVRTGDESAFRALYRNHAAVLYRVAFRMVSDADRAADIVQDTWIRAMQSLPAFRWQSSLATWLVGITINRAREEIRRIGNVQSMTNTALPSEDLPDPPARSSDPAQRLDLQRAIAQLPGGYREIFLLHDVEGFTHEEIAQALEIEPATSRSQLTRARASLRAWLDPRKES